MSYNKHTDCKDKGQKQSKHSHIPVQRKVTATEWGRTRVVLMATTLKVYLKVYLSSERSGILLASYLESGKEWGELLDLDSVVKMD